MDHAMTSRSLFSVVLGRATQEARGLGAFNVVLLEHAEAIVAGATVAGRDVVLQISENCITYHGGLAPVVAASRALAQEAEVDVVVHLDHIADADLVRQGVALGVDSVMFDASRLPYEENVRLTTEMTAYCHDNGVAVEAELGEVGGKDGVHAPGARTDPAEAAEFVARTGVDALAVAVGTSHAMRERVATVDRDLIHRLADAVAVPLVLHGSSGLSDEELQAAVTSGMRKINISTHLNGVFTRSVRAALRTDGDVVDPRRYIAPARTDVRDEVARILGVLG